MSKINNIIPLYFPVVLSYVFIGMPLLSYLIAWLGSFFIFYQTWFSKEAYLKTDLPMSAQIMRPIFLLQAIFAGFMCSTSIFYFLDHLGYQYFTRAEGEIFHENSMTLAIAQCQRYGLLAHAAVVTGIIWKTEKTNRNKQFTVVANTDFLIGLTIIFFFAGLLFQSISGLLQIALILNVIAISTGTLLFVKGITTRNVRFLIVGSFIFISNFLNSTLSGSKEPIIVNILFLFALLYPHAKKAILILTIPTFYILFYTLPTYSSIVRKSWSGDISAEAARNEAVEALLSDGAEDELDETNWQFLTNRLSEINMFTQFAQYVPDEHDYYGWEIFNQSITALIPRIFWPDKPNIETISMERVYEAGVVNRLSNVSAKTRPIVDAYVSWGIVGVFVSMLIYGVLAQWLCNKCEQLFGGYDLGCIIMFNSLFQTMWRGNNYEFMFSNIFYGAVLMYLIFWIMKGIKILQPLYSKLPDLPSRPNPFARKAKTGF